VGGGTTSHVKEPRAALSGEPGAATKSIRVVVVDDHDLFRSGLVRLLSEQDGIEVVEEAADGERAVRVVGRMRPDVVLMDLGLPGISGIEATRHIFEQMPGANVLVLTISDAERDVIDAILAGARGYLLKESTLDEIIGGIRSAAVGQSTLSPRIAARVLDRLRALEQSGRVRDGEAELTERELEILGLIAAGKENAEIGAELVISSQTVKNHVSSILAKLRLENRIQAAVHAVRRGIV
jgi:two-component system NarL family response regulator